MYASESYIEVILMTILDETSKVMSHYIDFLKAKRAGLIQARVEFVYIDIWSREFLRNEIVHYIYTHKYQPHPTQKVAKHK